MKRVLMTAGGPFVPIRQGSDRLIHDVAKYLNSLPDIELTLAIVGAPYEGYEKDYASVCQRVVWLRRPGRWSALGWFNKLCARCGITVFESVGLAVGMRKQMIELAHEADAIIMNYANWFAMLPKEVRRSKAICITHDLLFYRRASFNGDRTILQRLSVNLTRFFELQLFNTFRKVAVLGEYEREMLRDIGYPSEHVIRIGMPIEARKSEPREKKYDFITVSGAAKVNIDGVLVFLNRIAPLLAPRRVSYALAGQICKAKEFAERSPNNVELVKLGYVDDLAEVCAESRIGVAIVPAGSGIKVKTVEVMMRGLPVITTDHGIEGIPFTNEGIINIDREAPEAIARRLTVWLDNQEDAARIGRIQAEKVRKAFAPETVLADLLEEIRVGVRK